MFNKFVDIDCFLCNSYPSVPFESLPHVINLGNCKTAGNFKISSLQLQTNFTEPCD